MRLDFLEIEQFRGVRGLRLNRLGDVNLLLGNNDAGKTTVLEAVKMFEAPDNIDIILRNSRERLLSGRLYTRESYTPVECLWNLFPFSQEKKQISLRAGIGGQTDELAISGELVHILRLVSADEVRGYVSVSQRKDAPMTEQEVLTFQGEICYCGKVLPISVDEFYYFKVPLNIAKLTRSIKYMAPGDHLSGRNNAAIYQTSKKEELEIVELLQLIDPDIEGFKLEEGSTSFSRNQIIEHKRFGNIPLYTYGDGMKKILSLAANVVNAKNGILLIDEIETSLQTSNLRQVFTWLLRACRQFQVQLFVTTHSLEAISALAGCAVEDQGASWPATGWKRTTGRRSETGFLREIWMPWSTGGASMSDNPLFSVIVSEGIHDVMAITKILMLKGFEEVTTVERIPAPFHGLINQKYPWQNEGQKLTWTVSHPSFLVRDNYWVLVSNAGGESELADNLKSILTLFPKPFTDAALRSTAILADADQKSAPKKSRNFSVNWLTHSQTMIILNSTPPPRSRSGDSARPSLLTSTSSRTTRGPVLWRRSCLRERGWSIPVCWPKPRNMSHTQRRSLTQKRSRTISTIRRPLPA